MILLKRLAQGAAVAALLSAASSVAYAQETTLVVVMEHSEKSGAPKLVEACTLPLTGAGVVDLVITELGVFETNRGKSPVRLTALAPGVTLDEVKARTEAPFEVALG